MTPPIIFIGLSVLEIDPDVLLERFNTLKKDLLDFDLANLMFVFTLAVVASLPIEPFDFLDVDHECIFSWYIACCN